jgi:hypothetical protein
MRGGGQTITYFNLVGNMFLATNIFDTGITHFIKPGAIKMAELVTGEIRAHQGPLAVGSDGDNLSVDRFGASAPGERVLQEFGFTVDNVVERALALVART